MAIKRSDRQKVYEKFDGHCAYTGKQLGIDWQVDHVVSKRNHFYTCRICTDINEYNRRLKEVDHIDNLLPAITIINHYKRGKDLEQFRSYMLSFHKRIAKLPKKTIVNKSQRRKEYMLKIADLFGITPDKPFSGKFYFETINQR